MTILFSAAIAVLAAQTALAEQQVNKPFNTVNGRTTVASPAEAGGPTAGQAPAVSNAMINGAQAGGGRSFMGGGRQAVSRSSTGRATRRGGKAFWSGGRSAVEQTPAPTTEEAPPNFSKPGALIRTTGQQPVYEKAETRTHTVDAGEIVMNKRKAVDVGRAPSVQQGPKDTPPPPNPGTSGVGYSGGAAANTGPGSNGGNSNNGGGNNRKDKPGDDDRYDGDKAKEYSFYDAY